MKAENESPLKILEVIYPHGYTGKVWQCDPQKERSEKLIEAFRQRYSR